MTGKVLFPVMTQKFELTYILLPYILSTNQNARNTSFTIDLARNADTDIFFLNDSYYHYCCYYY